MIDNAKITLQKMKHIRPDICAALMYCNNNIPLSCVSQFLHLRLHNFLQVLGKGKPLEEFYTNTAVKQV